VPWACPASPGLDGGRELASVLVLGVSGPSRAGDTLFPASSLAAGLAQDLDPAANIFLRLRIFHPLIAAAVGACCCSSRLQRLAPLRCRQPGLDLVALLAAQIVAGVANLMLCAGMMQIVHLLLADLLWITLVLLSAAMLCCLHEQKSPHCHG